MSSLDAAYERQAIKEGLVKIPSFEENWETIYATYIFSHETNFWEWCIESHYNKDYILDNALDLFEEYWRNKYE